MIQRRLSPLWQEEEWSCKIFSKDKSAATRETCLQKANDIFQKTCGSCPNSSPTPETFIPTSSPIEFKDSKKKVAFLFQEDEWSCERSSKNTLTTRIENKCKKKAKDICHQPCGSCPNSSPTSETTIPTSNPIVYKDSTAEIVFILKEEKWFYERLKTDFKHKYSEQVVIGK